MLNCGPLSALLERRSDFWSVYLFFCLYAVLPAPGLASPHKMITSVFKCWDWDWPRGVLEVVVRAERRKCCWKCYHWRHRCQTGGSPQPSGPLTPQPWPARQQWPDSRYQPSQHLWPDTSHQLSAPQRQSGPAHSPLSHHRDLVRGVRPSCFTQYISVLGPPALFSTSPGFLEFPIYRKWKDMAMIWVCSEVRIYKERFNIRKHVFTLHSPPPLLVDPSEDIPEYGVV